MAKLKLSRTYTYLGKDYGPGDNVDVPDSIPAGKDLPALTPAADIQAKEKAYQDHLAAGGEPVAPITPGLATADSQPEGMTTLGRPPARRPDATADQPDTADRKTFRAASAPAPASSKEDAAKRGDKDKE